MNNTIISASNSECNPSPSYSEFIIEPKIPIPQQVSRARHWPFKIMNVGDSFAFQSTFAKRASVAAATIGKSMGAKFSFRKISETHHRVWRIS